MELIELFAHHCNADHMLVVCANVEFDLFDQMQDYCRRFDANMNRLYTVTNDKLLIVIKML